MVRFNRNKLTFAESWDYIFMIQPTLEVTSVDVMPIRANPIKAGSTFSN